jgi:hypothetical protein
MAPSQLSDDGFGHITGPASELAALPDVATVLLRLKAVGIDLCKYGYTLLGVYSREKYARPYGFDFRCRNTKLLLADVAALSQRKLAMRFDDFEKKPDPIFNEDTKGDPGGFVSALVTKGRGFRQIGTGEVLHIEIDLNDDVCNVHIDSHGYVVGPGQYDWIKSGDHGLWDLGSHYVPGLYPRLGKWGHLGPMITPMRGLDGKRHWTFGVQGEFN